MWSYTSTASYVNIVRCLMKHQGQLCLYLKMSRTCGKKEMHTIIYENPFHKGNLVHQGMDWVTYVIDSTEISNTVHHYK
jgi:hypothetical protein